MNNETSNSAQPLAVGQERRRARDRRSRTFHALVQGSLMPRRHGPRREGDRSLSAVDWHEPQWLAVAIFTLLLSVADALLTLMLLGRGASEANPVMEPLVQGSPLVFAVTKVTLTAGGIVLLILLARMRVFGRVPVSAILYGVLIAYAVLVAYEFWLLDALIGAI